jgi:hypothetical protein
MIDQYLRPYHVKPPPKNPALKYITDLLNKLRQSYFYFWGACAYQRHLIIISGIKPDTSG